MESYTGEQNFSGQELVSYQQGNLMVDNCCIPYPYYPQIYERYYPIYYPEIRYITEKSKIEQAFKILTKLLENKIITKEISAKEMLKLINDIAEVI